MNTQLLNQNNTTCTTKNLKIMAAVICMTAVFVFTNMMVFAQGISNSEGKTVSEQEAAKQKWVEEHRDELNKTNAPAVVKPAPVQTKATGVESDKKAAVKSVIPVTSAKQVVTPQSAETVDNAVNVTAPALENSNSVEAKQTKTLAEQRTTRPSSVAVRNEVKPYDKSTVVNEVNQNVVYPSIPGFVATGNADVDAKAFEVAKTNLQQNNPAEYTKYFSEKE